MTATAQDRETARGIAHRLNGLSGPALEDAIAAALTAARQEEREACAKVAEQHDICKECGGNHICVVCQSARNIAADIRGRARP